MAQPRDTARPPMADTGKQPSDASENERATQPAPVAGATPVAGESGRASADWDDDEGANWRHAPVAPKDASPLDSLGKSISDTVTGTGTEADPKRGPKT